MQRTARQSGFMRDEQDKATWETGATSVQNAIVGDVAVVRTYLNDQQPAQYQQASHIPGRISRTGHLTTTGSETERMRMRAF